MGTGIPATPELARPFRYGYGAGLGLCVVWPLLLQGLLGRAIHPIPGLPGPLVQQLGYSFTGLTCLCALGILWRRRRIRDQFARMPAGRRGLVMLREIVLYSVLCEFAALSGVLYFSLGGPERYARGFLALTTLMFFGFVPRLSAWRAAAGAA